MLKLLTSLRKQKKNGFVVILLAILLPLLIGFIALALDLARVWVVRNELQNAADAAALTGAAALAKPTPSSPNTTYANPNWNQASTNALLAVGLNQADGHTLVDGQAVSGYWNIKASPPTMQPTTITPTSFDKPAVQVTISKSTDNNGGPLLFYFAPFIHVYSIPISASSVAFVSAPGTANPGSLFPVAIDKCLLDNYWNSSTGQPINDPSTGLPYEFKIGSSYHYPPCNSGEWTSFQLNANDTTTIRNLIFNGNPTALNVGDLIWIEPGTKAALYASVPVPADVLLAVVQSPGTNTQLPIIAFAPFHIDASVGGSNKYIQGHFIPNYIFPGGGAGGGGGISYGAVIPPILGQ